MTTCIVCGRFSCEREDAANPQNPEGQSLRERVRSIVEEQVVSSSTGAVSLADILRDEPISTLLGDIKNASDQMCKLKEAIESSKVVALQGARVVLFLQRERFCNDCLFLGRGYGECSAFGSAIAGDKCDRNAFADCWGQDTYVASWPFDFGGYMDAYPMLDKRNVYIRIAKLLEAPSKEIASIMESDGSVNVYDLIKVEPMVDAFCFGKVPHLLRGVRLYARDILDVDEDLCTVRLLRVAERLCRVAEELVVQMPPCGQPMTVEDLSERDEIRNLLGQLPGSSTDRKALVMTTLVEALAQSKLLDFRDDVTGKQTVVHAPEKFIREKLEATLHRDGKARYRLCRDGVVPLTWLLAQPNMVRAFDRASVRGHEEALNILRKAVLESNVFSLDSPGICLQFKSHASQEVPPISGRAAFAGRAFGTMTAGAEAESSRLAHRVVPKAKDAKELRALLAFYFEPFNLQHNSLILGLLRTQRKVHGGSSELRCGYLRSSGLRPTFSLAELRLLPRLRDLFDKYSPEAAACLLALAVVRDSKDFPLQICAGRGLSRPRGAWATPDPSLELTYFPNLRFIEVSRACRATDALLSTDAAPCHRELTDPSAFLVSSYSISSELSHEQSPKTALLLDDILDGSLDLGAMSWEHRQSKIKRQLLMLNPDIICVQGIQSAGFANRCSEVDPIWFNTDSEPSTNHLVYLYRQLSKENYGVIFAPTLMQPGSDVTCFGNAIFWKRSRWHLGLSVGLQRGSAICAELTSKLGSVQLLVCCSKPAASYAKEWGGEVTVAEVAASICDVQALFADVAYGRDGTNRGKKRMLWCGDFGSELEVLLPELKARAEIAADAAEEAAEIACDVAAKAAVAAKLAAASAESDTADVTTTAAILATEKSTFAQAAALAAVKAAELAIAVDQISWRSACASVLGADVCTSASPHTMGQAVDLILHDHGLEALAVLGGLPNPVGFNELMRGGHPSDHLMQLALFMDAETNNSLLDSSVAFPILSTGSNKPNRRPRLGPAPPRPQLRNRSRMADGESSNRPSMRGGCHQDTLRRDFSSMFQ